MAGSTTHLDLIVGSQSQHDAVANGLIDAGSTAILFGRRASTTAALTWGYYGGTMAISSVPTVLANGTVALTASTTNYVYTTSGGVVTQTTSAPTGWPGPITSPAGAIALYQIVTGTATVTSYIDYRTTAVATGGGGAPTGPAGGDLTGTYPNPTVATNAVTNAKAAQMAAHTFKGNNTASTANAIDLTLAQATAEINAMVGDSGAGGTKGQVPAPAAGDAAALKFLKADGTWSAPSGSGAPTDATYITASANGTLTAEQVLTAGTGITLTPTGSPPTSLVIAATSGGGTFNWMFLGGGIDGACVLDGTNTFAWATKTGNDYAMIANVYATNLTVNVGCRLIHTSGLNIHYLIYCTGTLTVNGTISGAGQAAVTSTGGTGWGTTGTLGGSGSGAFGKGPGVNGNGNSVSAFGGVGGKGGVGGDASPNTGGTVADLTPPIVGIGGIGAIYDVLAAIHGRTAMGVSLTSYNGGGGGSGGAAVGGGSTNSGAGGGGGAPLHIIAHSIAGSGAVTAAGGNASDGVGGNTGGGGGGGGGVIQCVTTTSNWQSLLTVTAAGGTGGAPAGTGTAGSAGVAGRVIEYIVGA